MHRLAFLAIFGCTLLIGCADLRFLDSAISEEALAADPPELSPISDLPLPRGDTTAEVDIPQALSNRAARLQQRARDLQ